MEKENRIPSYQPPLWLRNGHLQTVWASRFRKVPLPSYQRERFSTRDGDFLDIDWIRKGNDKVIVLGHGMEGHSRRPYVTGPAWIFSNWGFDICAWNARSCSGEINRQPKLYNHADTEDLEDIVASIPYEQVYLLGSSMGGAIILNWLGKKGSGLPKKVRAAVAISTPLDIAAISEHMKEWPTRYYSNYFMEQLKQKVIQKSKQFPELLDIRAIQEVKSWREFDKRYSLPLTGYDSVEEFYYACSAINRIENIGIPTLLLNALDDPLLTPKDYQKKENPNMTYSQPKYGGHVAFLEGISKSASATTFADRAALEYIRQQLPVQPARPNDR